MKKSFFVMKKSFFVMKKSFLNSERLDFTLTKYPTKHYKHYKQKNKKQKFFFKTKKAKNKIKKNSLISILTNHKKLTAIYS